jgi:Uncharacterised protein conserved in bacteria (DUF2336)
VAENFVENLNLLLIELFASDQKQIGYAPEGFYPLFLGSAPDSILEFSNQGSVAMHREIFGDGSASNAEDNINAPRDYRTAELVVSSRPLTEAVVNEFAKSKKLEEIVVSIARLSGLPTTEIERLFLGTWSSPVAVILKAIGFHLATIEALYRARLSVGDPIRDDLTRTKAEFIALSRPTAERIVRFYRSRKSVEFTAGRT